MVPPPLPLPPLASPRPPELPFWSNGPFLIMRVGASLPHRCIKCNRPTGGGTVAKRLVWADTKSEPAGGALRWIPLVKVFFAFQSMFQWLGDLSTMRSAVVVVGLCPRHRLMSDTAGAIAYIALPASILAAFAIDSVQARLWLPVAGLFATAIILNRPRPVKAMHIGVTHVTVSGAGKAFLESIPTQDAPDRPSVDSIVSSVATLRDAMLAKKKSVK